MEQKELAELAIIKALEAEALNRTIEAGNIQLRRTFDMYLELLDKVNRHGRERREQAGTKINV